MNINKTIYWFAVVLAVIINLFSWQLPFFWDTILTSTITQYFYEHGFQHFITPAQLDAGHPPLFYVYVKECYNLFGKNLITAHLSMLPFTIMGVLCFINLLQHFKFNKQQQYTGVILYFSIPAVITQNCMVSYDAVLLSLYLAALLAVLKNKKLLFAIVSIGILGISLRGLFCIAALTVTIYFLQNRNLKSWLKWNVYCIPAIIFFVIWIYYHYTQTGWMISTNSETWSEHRGFANAFGWFKNTFSIVRCFFDLGIAILTLLSVFYLVQHKKADAFTLLWLIPALVFSISFLPFSNPVNHRYFLIIYVLMLFPVLKYLSDKKIIYSVITTFILILGHFLIYPVPVSNGWDCSLSHVSYFKCKDDFEQLRNNVWLDETTKTGTVFPLNASLHQTKMQINTARMININGKSIDSIPFILFSNIGNDFSDEQIKQLNSWIILYQKKCGLVELILYENPEMVKKKI
jgi:hypothetical protein